MKENSKIKKTFKIIGIVLMAIIIALLAGTVIFSLLTKNKGGVKYIGNHAIIRVLTGSMEPVISAEDYIIIKKVNPDELKEGDIITFVSSDPNIEGNLNTHRIIRIEGEQFVTKGDWNPTEDKYLVNKDDVVGKFTYKLTFMGVVFRVLTSTQGFIILIVVPMLIIIGLYLKDFVKSLKDNEKEKVEAEQKASEDDLIKAKLEEMKQSGELDEMIRQLDNEKNEQKKD